MNLTHLSPLGLALGALGLAGVAFLLQILRVRHREQVVVTTMFWKQAMQDERVRVFRERFRHPWAWALITAIAVLALFALARPFVRSEPDADLFVVVDGSAATDGAALARDLSTAAEVADALQPSGRHVVVFGSTPRTLLAPDEPIGLLAQRAKGIRPEAANGALDRLLPQLVQMSERPRQIWIVGAARLRADTRQRIESASPAGVEWFRVETPSGPGDSGDDAGGAEDDEVEIFSFGVDPELGVVAEIRAPVGAEIQLSAGGRQLAAPRSVASRTPGRIPDPASDELVETRRSLHWDLLTEAPCELELKVGSRTVSARWPGRRPILVAVDPTGAPSPELTVLVRDVVESSDALRWSDDAEAADVLVSSTVRAISRPTLVFGTPGAGADSFVFEGLVGDALERLVDRVSLTELDAVALATAVGRPVTVGGTEAAGAPRRVRVDRRLVEGQALFAGSRVFPVFVRESLRWLARRPEVVSHAAVGEPIETVQTPVLDPRDRRIDPVGQRFVPTLAGAHTTAAVQVFEASVQDIDWSADLSTPSSLSAIESVAVPTQGPRLDLARWIVLILLGLVSFEWLSVRRGRMP